MTTSALMRNPLDDPRFDRELLTRYHFDPEIFFEQVHRLKSGELTGEESFVRGRIEPASGIPNAGYDPASPDFQAAHSAGVEALRRGQVAVLVLNGGLATRFGGTVKGIVEVCDGRSFLGHKLENARRAAELWGAPSPVVLLNSFATVEPTRTHLADNDHFGMDPGDIYFMDQTISVRLEPNGDPFFGKDGQPRYYAPGHGEFFDVLLSSGIRQKLLDRGIRWFTFSNVDNLGATIDPVIIGRHIVSGAEMTVEVIEKRKNAQGQYDVGGSPVLVNGDLQVVEGFRFPHDLPPERLEDFQTNNMIFSLEAIREPMRLTRYLVRKSVDGRPSVAFEAISCEASGKRRPDGSSVLRLGLLRVPREGTFGRFYPVKSREDLELLRDTLRERLASNWQFWRGLAAER